MENQKLRKLLNVLIAASFLVTKCAGGDDAFNKEFNSVGASSGAKRKAVEIEGLIGTLLQPSMPDHKRQKKGKKTLNDKTSPLQKEVEITLEDSEEGSQSPGTSQPNRKYNKKYNKINLKDFDIDLWNKRKLENKRRVGYKLNHRSIYIEESSDDVILLEVKEELYQSKLKWTIKNFATELAHLIEKNAMWYFIACNSSNIKTKYKDLMGLVELLKDDGNAEIRETLEGFTGYYPKLFEDMMAYINAHKPMRTLRYSPLTSWTEKIGDIYIRKTLEPNYCMPDEQEEISQINKRYHTLAYAVRMILALPEVCQDFSKITAVFITTVNTPTKRVLLSIKKMVHMNINKIVDEEVYEALYKNLEVVLWEKKMGEITVLDLYRQIYKILGDFYKVAPVCDRETEHILTGKNVIVNQDYTKCEMTVKLPTKDSDRKVNSLIYSSVMNKWNVSSTIETHYHIYYIDNTSSQPICMCMPMYVDENGKEDYLLSIDSIVQHIKMLYRIEEKSEDVYPFKLRKETGQWSYVRKEERKKTAKELVGYEVVFYRIEKGVAEGKFTFAEFWPFKSHAEGSVCIPLFLTPLMQAAVELGPFAIEGKHTELDSIEFENRKPDVYKYDKKKHGSKKCANVQNYYANLYLLPDEDKRANINCYIMDCKAPEEEDSTVKAVWYIKIPRSVGEYTHCMPDDTFKKEKNLRKISALAEIIESREYNKDSEFQSFWLSGNIGEETKPNEQAQIIHNWIVRKKGEKMDGEDSPEKIRKKIDKAKEKLKEEEKRQESIENIESNDLRDIKLQKNAAAFGKCFAKRRMNDLKRTLLIKLSKRPTLQTDLIVFRNVNSTKSNLGAHNEIFDTLISLYNRPVYVKTQ
ncbi:hypothetical protein NEMIN01_1620 [Nematocida minor]|uniref:uncharacterized protein n=1 Tax=Nematocida minor TaxID=1912983 RepID=UPI00221F9605|nr:uncharacterized protein NEMIN01_1620 [Nematocida minor]KAI5191687.1 hypothetical protein NEMIN01_1620 [Nematocida minor]